MYYSDETIIQIWQKAQYVSPENEARGFRKDECGAWIKLSDYGNRDSPYGWEIDHIFPQSLGGSDELYNLRPLHWENNIEKAGRPYLSCAVTSDGTSNYQI